MPCHIVLAMDQKGPEKVSMIDRLLENSCVFHDNANSWENKRQVKSCQAARKGVSSARNTSIPHGHAILFPPFLNRKGRKTIQEAKKRTDMLSLGSLSLEPGTGVVAVVHCQIPAHSSQNSAPAIQNGCPSVKLSFVFPVFQVLQSIYPAIVTPLRVPMEDCTNGVCCRVSKPDSHKTLRIHLNMPTAWSCCLAVPSQGAVITHPRGSMFKSTAKHTTVWILITTQG